MLGSKSLSGSYTYCHRFKETESNSSRRSYVNSLIEC